MLFDRSETGLESLAASLLGTANIRIGGNRPWDICIHEKGFYQRVLRHGSIGLGESYVDGWWDAEHLDEFFERLLAAKLDEKVRSRWIDLWQKSESMLLNRQGRSRAADNSIQHYDRGSVLYQAMLDSRMVYSCGYWKNASSLEQAQEAKLDLICRKLQLTPRMRVLDIGCGWGGLARYAAESYQVNVTGITVSPQQCEFARQTCKGLPVDIRLMDYRELTGTYDRVVSVGMFEHVGSKNHRTYMEVVSRCLSPEGLLLLQSIGGSETSDFIDPWIDKYIFPGAVLPSIKQIGASAENMLVMEDWHSFGPDYDRTLMAWFENFDRSWPELRVHFDDRFYRTWKYYLLSCAATFRVRKNQLWQIVFSKGRRGVYTACR
jgi:cyclopropane-fatty-acyl-phospholipid synthase